MFVRDEKRELLVLPMILSSAASNQRCEVEMDAAGNEVFRECRDDEHIDTSFAGLKAMKVDIDSGIQETASYNYLPLLKDHELVHTNRDG